MNTKKQESNKLIQLRDELGAQLRDVPGVLAVGLTKVEGRLTFVVSVNPDEFRGDIPSTFRGYGVQSRDLGKPIAHMADNRPLRGEYLGQEVVR